MQKTKIFLAGLAIFTLLFGAGNVAFPLDLGRMSGASVAYALAGLCITGVLVPMIGLVATMLFEGNYTVFLQTLGVMPGNLIILVVMLLFGPFGATPRCVILAHAAVAWHLPWMSVPLFSLLVACLAYVAAVHRGVLVELFGRFIGPAKLTLLLSLIGLGLLAPQVPPVVTSSNTSLFLQGIHEGYLTLDLLGTILFSSFIISFLRKQAPAGVTYDAKQIAWWGLQAGVVGGLLLAMVYAGFCVVAAMYSVQVMDVEKSQILSALAILILGPRAGLLANATVTLACISTAIALTTVFSEYVYTTLFRGRHSYRYAVLMTVVATFAMANLGFSGLGRFMEPIVVVVYPGLIALSLTGAAQKVWGFAYARHVSLATFVVAAAHKAAMLLGWL